MDDRIKEFCERLEFERKWLTSAGHLSSDIDIAFSAIRSKFLELFDKQEEPTVNALPLTKEEAELLAQCLSNYFYQIGGVPGIVLSCASKLNDYIDRIAESEE